MGARRSAVRLVALAGAAALAGFAALAACRDDGAQSDATGARESPQASAQPALLGAATAPPSAAPVGPPLEAGPPPTPLRGDEVLAHDVLAREVAGYTLSAVLRSVDVLGPPRTPEVSAAGLDAARRATELRVAIDLSPARLRVVLQGRGFVLPSGTELRARADRYGHVVLWPGADSYRPLPPGSMRALLGERRFDVAPITSAEVKPAGDGPRRIGIRTRRAEITTRAGRAEFEIGKLEGAGEGGVLLCRLLLDLMNAPPGGVCTADEVPVRAELHWTEHGALAFELTGTLRRSDVPGVTLLVPPPSASYSPTLLPTVGVAPILGPAELAALRTGDADVTPAPNAPEDGLIAVNPSVELRMLYVDGVPIAWAAPYGQGEIKGLHRGRYVAQWRTFLGDVVDPPITITVPGVVQLAAAPDAGR